MITHKLLIKCDDKFEGTVDELCEHLKIKDTRNIVRNIKEGRKIKGHLCKIIGEYRYYKIFEITDKKGTLIVRGSASSVAKKLYTNEVTIREAAKRKRKIIFNEYYVKDLGSQTVLKLYE